MAPLLFNIRTVDSAGTAKLESRITLEEKIDDDKATLDTIRQFLVKQKLDSAKVRLAFCGKDGARVGDDFKWSIYKTLVEEDDDKKKTSKIETHDVYFELPKEKEKEEKTLSKQAQAVLDSKLDMDLVTNKPALITATLKELASAYEHNKFQAASGGVVVTAGSMSENDWDVVLRHTHYLNGYRMVFSPLENGTKQFKRIDKAPYAAFIIRPRKIFNSEKADKSINVEAEYRIPRYIVTDDSYVNVFETASSLSESVASSSFSQTDIEASAGGSLFGASMSVKAGFSKNDSEAVATATSSSSRSMNITYNFPRVVLHLDSRSLELTDECKVALEGIKDEDSLIQFHRDFGHFFATNVELGGKLFASEKFTSAESSKAEEKANAMKVSAAASFSYGSFEANVSASHEKQKNSASSNSSSSMSKTLTWEARGGDTILCNDPPNWCPTVKPSANWRVINQRDVMPMADFIGTFPDYKHIPADIDRIRQNTTTITACKFRLKANVHDGVKDDEYYGVRRDNDGERLKPYLNKYRNEIIQCDNDEVSERTLANAVLFPHLTYPAIKFYQALESRMKGAGFTDNFKEYVGIDDLDKHGGGCNFEVEVATMRDEAPKLKLNVPYLIRAHDDKHDTYLAADTSGSYGDRFFGYMYYARKIRASKFMFRKVGARRTEGIITNNMEVELTLCDDSGDPYARVQRFEGDSSTLVVSKYGVEGDFTEAHNATFQYN